jgi:hypothetical protein
VWLKWCRNQVRLLAALAGPDAAASVVAALAEVGVKTNEVPMAAVMLGQIDQQALKPPAARRATAHRATADSLRQLLDAARAENTCLRAENRSLRDQLARHLGLQRTQHHEHTSAEPR